MPINQIQCLISDSRGCKASAQTDLVFIIGSGSDEFKPDILAILEVLAGFGFPGNFALLSDKSKGLDVFCDKICSKIREAQFCIVMLNDPLSLQFTSLRVPSANVYYEFGLAVAQGRGIIPIIRRGLNMPFDVQHLDAIIYDDLDDLKTKLKKSIVGTLRKIPKAKLEINNSEFQKLIYGPLYNEIDIFIQRADRFSNFECDNYWRILERYKYLFDKTDKAFQKSIQCFFKMIEQFNTYLVIAEQATKKAVKAECIAFFKIENMTRLRVEILNELNQTSTLSLEDILFRKTSPELFLKVDHLSNEKVIAVTYRLERAKCKDHILSHEESMKLIELCKAKVENDPQVMTLRKMERSLKIKAKKLRQNLKKIC